MLPWRSFYQSIRAFVASICVAVVVVVSSAIVLISLAANSFDTQIECRHQWSSAQSPNQLLIWLCSNGVTLTGRWQLIRRLRQQSVSQASISQIHLLISINNAL